MKVYFAGAIRAGRDSQKYCQIAIDEISKYVEVLTEHVGSANLSIEGEKFDESYIYTRDMSWLKEADLIIAEVTTPSLGVGYEIAYAEMWEKPIVCLYKSNNEKKLSAMILGSSKVSDKIKIFEYENVEHLQEIIRNYFKIPVKD